MEPSVLFIASPWRHPGEPALALPILCDLARRAGLRAETLFGSLLYPRTEVEPSFLDRYGSFLFAPWAAGGPTPESARDAILARYADDLSLGGVRCSVDEARLRLPRRLPSILDDEIVRAGRCVERVAERVVASSATVVCFSVTFESQLPATLAIIDRFKRWRPEVPVALGGAGCQEEQALGILRSFPLVDAVCAGEGEAVVAPLCRALAGDGALADVPGIAYRKDGRAVRTAAPPLLRDLDALPMARYDDFFDQLDASEWRDAPVNLLFETSRGCWWGQKHLCSFCGLNGEGLPFRAKSPARAFAEITRLYRDYPRAVALVATDNIIAMPYFDKLLPQLAALPREPGRPLQLFYEIKSNLTSEQVELLAAAGVRAVQPGIESFSDEVLALMDKGCTGLGQVQFVKWAAQAGILANYNILIRNPGESAAAYREMAALMRCLYHLQPPANLVVTQLERFSPYHRDPARYGMDNVRLHHAYRWLFPESDGRAIDYQDLAYQFEFDHPMLADAELLDAHRELLAVLEEWQASAGRAAAFYVEDDEAVVVVDGRPGGRTVRLAGVAADIFQFVDRARSFAQIERHFPEVEPGALLSLLERWHIERLVYASPPDADGQTRHLALLPRRGPRRRVAVAEPRPSLQVLS